MKISKKIKIFFIIYFSIFIPLLSALIIYSKYEGFKQNLLSYTNDDNDKECAISEICNKNFSKLALAKIAPKIKQGFFAFEKLFVFVFSITKTFSQLNHPLRC